MCFVRPLFFGQSLLAEVPEQLYYFFGFSSGKKLFKECSTEYVWVRLQHSPKVMGHEMEDEIALFLFQRFSGI